LTQPLVHKHLVVRAEVSNPPKSTKYMKEWLENLIDKIGMKILQHPGNPMCLYHDVPGNRGMTALAIIETSNLAIHVWDECDPGLMEIDVYSCGPFTPEQVISELNEFEPTKIEWLFLDRDSKLTVVDKGQE
jgi:S-adenosylmethionine/arginine decarboxylase-like enzyme